MSAVENNVNQTTRNKAIEAARWLPHGADAENSRTADKFVIRGYKALFSELDRLAVLQQRSKNSECIMAILESLRGRKQTTATSNAMRAYMGEQLSAQVLAAVPKFVMPHGKPDAKFVIRFPNEVRDLLIQASTDEGFGSMIAWTRDALEYWILAQRQEQALLAAIAELQ